MPSIAQLTGDELNGDHSLTFEITGEGHTMGNVLKSIIGKYPDVMFCGYTVPHPAEQKMHFRIQANPDTKAIDVLRRGLKDLLNICDHTLETFESAMENRCSE